MEGGLEKYVLPLRFIYLANIYWTFTMDEELL